MEELFAQLSAIARSMWRFRWLAVAVAWAVAIVGTAIVFRIPDQYEASARVFVDTQSILKPLMSGLAVQPNIEQQVVMLSRTLVSRPNVEKMVRMADLDLKSRSPAEHEALVTRLMTGLEIKSAGRDNLYTLSFRDSDPETAQRVVQSIVSIFVESSLGASRKDTDTAKVFLNEQIKAYEAKLREAEARLQAFRIRNIDIQAGEGKDSASRLAELGEQLKDARLALREAEQSRDAARKQLESAGTGSATPSAGMSLLDGVGKDSALGFATPEIDARIDAQKRNLDTLLQRFTEQHPDIISTRKLIHDLEEQKKKQVEELRQAAASAPAAANPASDGLNQMLATWEVQVAALKARVAEYSSRYSQALESAKAAPRLEAEASQLNRDYEINKQNYQDLVKRRESASMSGELDLAAGVADFRLIDPPRVSPKPVSPNRLVLLLMAMVLALAAGLFSAFAASQLRPVFYSASELRSKFAFPLLGMVSMLASDADVRREKTDLLRFLLASGSLIGIFVAALITMSVIAARQG